MKKIVALLLCLAMCISLFAGCTVEILPAEAESTTIALISISPTDPYWKELGKGSMRAASELGVKVVSLGPDAEENEQISDQIHTAVQSGCQVIVISAGDSDDVPAALQVAADTGVKIICVDSAVGVESAVVLKTDQQAAGKAAAEVMLQVLDARRIREGQIGIIGTNTIDSAAAQREAGFREAFAGSAYTLLETQYGEGDVDKSRSIAEDYLSQGVVGLFGCDANSAAGAGWAAREIGTRPVVTGFGESEEARNLMEDGSVRAIVTPNWDNMGYEAVKAAVAALEGSAQEGQTNIGVTVLQSGAPVTANSDYQIALIAEERIDQYWISLEEGAMKAASEIGCEVSVFSPTLKDEAQQIQQIKNAVSSGFQAIVVGGNVSDAVAGALQEAAAAGMKVICVDAPTAGMKAAATVLTDSRAAGRTAGETLISALAEREIAEGSIGIIGVNPDTELFAQREEGFRDAFEGTSYTLLETQYSEGDAAKSHAIAKDYLDEDVLGILCVSKGCTVGAGNAAREEDADALVVGFDSSDVILEMIEEGWLLAAIAQNADAMGYEAVKAACAALNGENPDGTVINIDASVHTG